MILVRSGTTERNWQLYAFYLLWGLVLISLTIVIYRFLALSQVSKRVGGGSPSIFQNLTGQSYDISFLNY